MRIELTLTLATITAIAALAFHLIYGSSILNTVLRTSIAWLGVTAWLLLFKHSLNRIMLAEHKRDNSAYEQRKRLDIASHPETEDRMHYQ